LLSLTDRPALTVDGSHSLTGHGLHRSLASKKAAIGFSYEGSSSAGKSKQSDDKENSEESAEEEDYADVDLGTSALADSGGAVDLGTSAPADSARGLSVLLGLCHSLLFFSWSQNPAHTDATPLIVA